jgi:hypothetical protein
MPLANTDVYMSFHKIRGKITLSTGQGMTQNEISKYIAEISRIHKVGNATEQGEALRE